MTVATRPVGVPLQEGLYRLLTADEMLAGRVVDHVPEDKPTWYVTLGESIDTPDHAHGEPGWQSLITLHVWSSARGFVEAKGVAGRLVELLDHQHQALAIEGHRTAAVWFVDANAVRDPDPDIRHIPVRFRVLTQQEV